MEELQVSDDGAEAQVHLQLKRAREERGLSIDALARRAGVRRAVLASLEAGDYAALPSGLYGRHAVRAYARAVGVDPEAAVAAAAPMLPVMDDPIAALARLRGLAPARPAVPEAPRSDHGRETPRSEHGRDRRASPWSCPRVVHAATTGAATAGTLDALLPEPWPRVAASLVDALLFTGLTIALAQLTAWAAAAPLEAVAPAAAPAWAVVLLVIGAAYFGLERVCHETLGTRAVQRLAARAVHQRESRRARAVQVGDAELRDRLCF